VEVSDILSGFPGARVLVVGDVMLDRYWWGSATRISPEAPVPVVGLERVSCVPGGAANVAANVAGFGAAAMLAGVVGDDESGRLLRAALSERGIDHSALVVDGGRPTTTKTRVLVHNHQLARIDDETRRPLASAAEDELFAAIAPLIADAGVVVLSDYAKGCLTPGLIRRIVEAASAAGRAVLADPKSRDFSRYDGVTVLTPNLTEALEAAGIDPHDPVPAATGIRSLAGREAARSEAGPDSGNAAAVPESDAAAEARKADAVPERAAAEARKTDAFAERDAAEADAVPERDAAAVALAAAAAERILASTAIGSLLVTLSEHGMALFDREAPPVHFPSRARQVFDVTGAGDTVIATLATALAARATPTTAATLANIAAGISVEKVGTSIVGTPEIAAIAGIIDH
jgi:D-beta-D-heptose 7-phosphate kinase/D-beta-D-heptose 1-phosphate adenosyltransferase